MTRILAALILSTAAIGAAQAGELGYLDNPAAHTQSSVSRAQVQQELIADRADADAFQGQLDPTLTDTRVGANTRSEVVRELQIVKIRVAAPTIIAQVNG
jgi:hypothetical protein